MIRGRTGVPRPLSGNPFNPPSSRSISALPPCDHQPRSIPIQRSARRARNADTAPVNGSLRRTGRLRAQPIRPLRKSTGRVEIRTIPAIRTALTAPSRRIVTARSTIPIRHKASGSESIAEAGTSYPDSRSGAKKKPQSCATGKPSVPVLARPRHAGRWFARRPDHRATAFTVIAGLQVPGHNPRLERVRPPPLTIWPDITPARPIPIRDAIPARAINRQLRTSRRLRLMFIPQPYVRFPHLALDGGICRWV